MSLSSRKALVISADPAMLGTLHATVQASGRFSEVRQAAQARAIHEYRRGLHLVVLNGGTEEIPLPTDGDDPIDRSPILTVLGACLGGEGRPSFLDVPTVLITEKTENRERFSHWGILRPTRLLLHPVDADTLRRAVHECLR